MLLLNALANVAAGQTDAAVIAAVAGKQIKVVQISFIPGGTATNVTFNSKGSGAGTAISPLFAAGANGQVTLPFSEKGWFTTNTGEGLSVTTGAGATVGILVGYELV